MGQIQVRSDSTTEGHWLQRQRLKSGNANTSITLLSKTIVLSKKKRIAQGLGFKEFESAKRTIAGIEIVHMIKKNQMISQGETMFDSFTSLAA